MAETLTPMMQQYQSIRRSLPADVILLFRLGDFYEMFFDDAKEASGILNVALTKRNGTPMCGVPFHAAEGYVGKLVKAGKRVAICDQVSEPQPGKIVQREVTQLVSAGTVSDLNLLQAEKNNFLAAICRKDNVTGLASIDLSTGEFQITEFKQSSGLLDELSRLSPSEILVPDDQDFSDLVGTQPYDSFSFQHEYACEFLREHFDVQSLDGFGAAEVPRAISAAGAILHYLKNQMRRQLGHVTRLRTYSTEQYLILDATSQANLELVHSRGERDISLLKALNRTVTPMGARRLRHWILHPLRDLQALLDRQETVQAFLDETFLLEQVREALRGIRDIERTVGRLSQGFGNGRDLLALRGSLEQLPELRVHLQSMIGRREFGKAPTELLRDLSKRIGEFPQLLDLLTRALDDEAPANLKEGGIFKTGYNADLDELRNASREGKDWIAELQEQEIVRTGIKSLKVRYNSVFGYYIEVTNSNLSQVPPDYVRKQTTANSERFVTPGLKEMEGKILGADERAKQLEYDLFLRLRGEVLNDLSALQETASALASLDVLSSFAETARLFGHVRPELSNDLKISIRDGRHPVLDQNLASEKFVPNDLELDGDSCRLAIITGPNMAGKSTYIRQAALLVLMAQMGTFIPAARAEIGLADRIFTRVGASDDLSRGQSTFMVEMNETANIVNNATAQSLIILDEIGRGTSTFDGLSIAWSIAEFLHDDVKARTLFATHYHELTDLEKTRNGVKNFNVAVREWNDDIIFLRKIVKGAADKSYGIQVGRLAGLPKPIIDRAKEILRNLEQLELNADGKPSLAEERSKALRKRSKPISPEAEKPQLKLFEL